MGKERRARLELNFTERQWWILEKNLSLVNKKSLNNYIISEADRIKSILDDCPDCVKAPDGKIKKRPGIPVATYVKIKKIASKLNMSYVDVVEKIIINPLLQEGRSD